MTGADWAVLAAAAVLVFWMVGAHNRVVALRNAIVTAWAQCDELLQRRAATVLPLLETLRPLMPAEQGTLDAVMTALQGARRAGDAVRPRPARADTVAALGGAETALSSTLARLTALVEQDAQARQADEVAVALRALRDLDGRLGFARQLFNDAAEAYNQAVGQFPTRLLAPLFRFGKAGLL